MVVKIWIGNSLSKLHQEADRAFSCLQQKSVFVAGKHWNWISSLDKATFGFKSQKHPFKYLGCLRLRDIRNFRFDDFLFGSRFVSKLWLLIYLILHLQS